MPREPPSHPMTLENVENSDVRVTRPRGRSLPPASPRWRLSPMETFDPDFEIIKMDAEVASYQEDFDPDRDGRDAESFAGPEVLTDAGA